MVPKKQPLKRLPADDDIGSGSRYLHPNGYVICQRRRTWSEQVGAVRGQATAGPLTWWEIYPHASTSLTHRFKDTAHRRNYAATADTLRDARHWCDKNPRSGWLPTTTHKPQEATTTAGEENVDAC